MAKYRMLRDRVAAAGLPDGIELLTPQAATDEQLLLAHSSEYVIRATAGALNAAEQRQIGFPWSTELVERSRRSCGATIQAARSALECGFGVNLAGGTHHAFRDHGAGFCLFNDTVVAARSMQAEGRIRRALVVDLDVHQGDGTASILVDDPTIFTLSMHAQRCYPYRKQRSDVDVALPDGTDDAEYLDRLEQTLSAAVQRFRPDLAIYLAGADPYMFDRFGRLGLTKEGLSQRDRLVLDWAASRGLPVAITMAGGYARRLEDVVDVHFATVELAVRRAQTRGPSGS